MYNKWDKDLDASAKALLNISDSDFSKVIRGNIISCETDIGEIGKALDIFAGIDLISIFGGNIRGIASRVQWGTDWRTFTVRYRRRSGKETEYEKRTRQIEDGALYPYLTMQSYFDNRTDNNLLSIAVCRTMDLYKFIIENPELCIKRESDNIFYVIKWVDMERFYRVKWYSKTP